ncbi:MAG: glycosyltransferase family 2 protein [Planctomycetota bacterium]|nr:glycosyltransferase family 2 protein [Planctomycetota bacterium]
MRLSVIISTYNSPDWLEKTLWGYAAQTFRNFEIVVADDGSTAATALRIEAMRRRTGLAIQHVWHEDRGFRKCAILNRAIQAASHDYLVITDGDCIPRADFLDTHFRLAQPGHFLSGGLFRLPRELSHNITTDDILEHRIHDTSWLRAHGVRRSLKMLKLACSEKWSHWLDRITPTQPSWNGHNASAWKQDILRVNGFDERMEYGAEDREMGERLIHIGVVPVQIRHRAVCVHLDHDRGYIRQEACRRNMRIWKETCRMRAKWTPFGITKQLDDYTVTRAARLAA